jgi:uncharacterized protein (DUF2384 family)
MLRAGAEQRAEVVSQRCLGQQRRRREKSPLLSHDNGRKAAGVASHVADDAVDALSVNRSAGDVMC